MKTEARLLEYFISRKEDFLVVSLRGTLTKATIPTLDECQAQVAQSGARHVVISMHDVETLEIGGVPGLIRLQKAIRDRAQLRLCFLRAEHGAMLADAGAIRPAEVVDTLVNALQSFAKSD
jgi:hypothetical protein